jgi:uncharacterized protein (TIGR04141 family)
MQVSKGALVILPVGDKHFALSFGHVAHNLDEFSYEYDFGIRVTLNSLDPDQLRSTDFLEPGNARRRRVQVPIGSDLTFFDFDRDSTILKSLSGKVKESAKRFFKHATGAANVRLGSDIESEQLPDLCKELLTLYESEGYKEFFPDIQNVTPVRDPALIDALNANLLAAFRNKDERLALAVPAIINYEDNIYATFSGAGVGKEYEEVYIAWYYEYLNERGQELDLIDIPDLKKHRLVLRDEDGNRRDSFAIYKSLIYDTTLQGFADTFYMSEGNWYRVESDYVQRLNAYLEPLWTELDLPPFEHASEGAYNEAVANGNASIVCLDKGNVSPVGQKAVEPCDLYTARDEAGIFYHVKVSTLSSHLSHLFNQGANSIDLIRSEDEARDKLITLVEEKAAHEHVNELLAPLHAENHIVVFAIITHKDANLKAQNLPLFSRVSLRRAAKDITRMRAGVRFGFVEDRHKAAEGRKRKRKARGANAAAQPT